MWVGPLACCVDVATPRTPAIPRTRTDRSGTLAALFGERSALGPIAVLAVESVQIGSLDVLFVALALAVLHIGDAGVGVLNAALGLGGGGRAAVTPRPVRGGALPPRPPSSAGAPGGR